MTAVAGPGKPDDLLAVTVACRLGLLHAGGWPEVATRLLVRGFGGPATAELAGAGGHLVPSQVDELVDAALPELGLPVLDGAGALEVVVRLAGQAAAMRGGEHFWAVGALAPLVRLLDYPEELYEIDRAVDALTCGCGACSSLAGDVDALEARLRASRPLDIDPGLLMLLPVLVG